MNKFSALLIALSSSSALATTTVVIEKNVEGTFTIPVCGTTSYYCPGVGSTVTFELVGFGGDGGLSKDSGICGIVPNDSGETQSRLNFLIPSAYAGPLDPKGLCGNGGAGGSAGGSVSFKYVIPNHVANISFSLSKSTPLAQGVSQVKINAYGGMFTYSSGNTSYQVGSFVLANAYAGYVGARGTSVLGGSGPYMVPSANAGKVEVNPFLVSVIGSSGSLISVASSISAVVKNPATSVASLGAPGVAAVNCAGGAGGAGGASNSTFGAGGAGARGRICDEPSLTPPQAGKPGRIRVSWDSPTGPGVAGSVHLQPGVTQPLCPEPTASCPGYGRPLVVELWGSGANGSGGQSSGSQPVFGGAGGDGGGSGGYKRFSYSPNGSNTGSNAETGIAIDLMSSYSKSVKASRVNTNTSTNISTKTYLNSVGGGNGSVGGVFGQGSTFGIIFSPGNNGSTGSPSVYCIGSAGGAGGAAVLGLSGIGLGRGGNGGRGGDGGNPLIPGCHSMRANESGQAGGVGGARISW